MFGTVLVGTDLSPTMGRILACLPSLRDVGTREVVLVHALGIRHLQEMEHALAPLVEPALAAERTAVEQMGLRASVEIAAGIPAPEICRIALERYASLILLGAASSRLREIVLGSVTIQVLHRSEIPVLVCRGLPDTDATPASEVACANLRGHVLYATDFSGAAERALALVDDLVGAGARRVTLVHVQDGALVDRGRLEHLAKRLLLEGADDVRVETPAGTPQDEIIRMVAEQRATIVVMGTTGRGSASTALLGSVSHAVARQAAAPVLLVPPARPQTR